MSSMNKQLNLPSLNNIMKEFERQNEKMVRPPNTPPRNILSSSSV
jgi:division protein CdvB (Snf7/Vps24/ESCRT-III family)